MDLETHSNGVIPAEQNLPSVELAPSYAEQKKEEARKAQITELYRVLKLASEMSGKVSFSSYYFDKLKKGEKIEEYYLDEICKELLFAECHLHQVARIFGMAKEALVKASGNRILEEMLKE